MIFDCVGISDDGNPIDGFANARFPPTVKPISIPDSWRFSGRKGLKSGTKTNTCWIREVSAICVYGLHHSTIYGIMQPVHGFVWPFVVWLHIVRFREMQRFVLCTEYRITPPKTARNEKSPVSRSIRSTGLSYILIASKYTRRSLSPLP